MPCVLMDILRASPYYHTMDAGFFIDLLFPAACAACGARIARGALCGECRMAIVPHRTAFCGTCAAALPGMRSACHPRAPYVLGAAGNYRNPVLRTLIHALKFGRVKAAAGTLGDVIAHYAARLPIDLKGFSVIPVPIAKERRRERGFNQAELIAARVAEFFGLPIERDVLVRTAHRGPQSDIEDPAERRLNVRNCYAVLPRPGERTARAPGKVVLIDDVTTSGATFTESATALRAAGTRKILALAAAKSV